MFWTIWLNNFFLSKVIWEHHSFTHQKKNQLHVWAYLVVQIKNFFSTIKDLPIWFDLTEKKKICQKSYGKKTRFNFVHTQIDPKVASYWLVSSTLHYNCIRCLSVYRIAIGISINLNIIRVIWHLLGDKSERTSLRF